METALKTLIEKRINDYTGSNYSNNLKASGNGLQSNNLMIKALINQCNSNDGLINIELIPDVSIRAITNEILNVYQAEGIDFNHTNNYYLYRIITNSMRYLDGPEKVNHEGKIMTRINKLFYEYKKREIALRDSGNSNEFSGLQSSYTGNEIKFEFPQDLKIAYDKLGSAIGKLYKPLIGQVFLTDKVFWQSNQYGQSGSCWWNRDCLEDYFNAGGIALLLEADIQNHTNRDAGRVWILPFRNNSLIAFNAYERIIGDGIRTFNKIFNQLFKNQVEITNLELTNYGHTNGDFYINGDAKLITFKKFPETIKTEIDLNIGQEILTCYDCGNDVDESDCVEYNGHVYCNSCCFYCEECNESFPTDCVDHYETDNHDSICEDCANDHYVECGHCGYYVRIP
jgi:hypothetical protein